MGFTVGAKNVVLCGLAALLLTYAAFHDKFPHGDGVSVQGRKGLTDSQLTRDDVVATEGVTVEATPEAVAENVMPTEENVEFTQEDSEELHEEKPVREMEEIAPAAEPQVVTPEPEYDNPNPFLQQIQQNNAEAAKKEDTIQACMAADGCGTPDTADGV